MRPPKPKQRLCKVCQTPFTQYRSFELWCSPPCGAELALRKLEAAGKKKKKEERKADKARLLQLEPLEYFHKLAERAFNAYIRARDAHLPCISCGRTDAEVWNAGHYISVGANRTLRYDEDNVHKQCARPCNKDKGGNAIQYRLGLLERIGAARVERLEGWHEPRKWTREELLEIQAHYKAKLRALKVAA